MLLQLNTLQNLRDLVRTANATIPTSKQRDRAGKFPNEDRTRDTMSVSPSGTALGETTCGFTHDYRPSAESNFSTPRPSLILDRHPSSSVSRRHLSLPAPKSNTHPISILRSIQSMSRFPRSVNLASRNPLCRRPL